MVFSKVFFHLRNFQYLEPSNDHSKKIKNLAHIWRSNVFNILRQKDEQIIPNHIFKIIKMEEIFDDAQKFFVDLEQFLGIRIKYNL